MSDTQSGMQASESAKPHPEGSEVKDAGSGRGKPRNRNRRNKKGQGTSAGQEGLHPDGQGPGVADQDTTSSEARPTSSKEAKDLPKKPASVAVQKEVEGCETKKRNRKKKKKEQQHNETDGQGGQAGGSEKSGRAGTKTPRSTYPQPDTRNNAYTNFQQEQARKSSAAYGRKQPYHTSRQNEDFSHSHPRFRGHVPYQTPRYPQGQGSPRGPNDNFRFSDQWSHHQPANQAHNNGNPNFSFGPGEWKPPGQEFSQAQSHMDGACQGYGPRSPMGHGQTPTGPHGQRQNTPERGRNTPHGGKKKNTPQKPKQQYQPYWDMENVQRGLKTGELIQGAVRINPKNFEDAYIPHPDGQSDIYIPSMKERNRALNGDIVVIQLKDRENWKVFMDDLNAMDERQLTKGLSQMSLSDTKNSETESTSGVSDSENDVIIEEEYYEENNSDTEPSKCNSTSQKENDGKTDGHIDGKDRNVQTVQNDCDNKTGADSEDKQSQGTDGNDACQDKDLTGSEIKPKQNVSAADSNQSKVKDRQENNQTPTKGKGQGPKTGRKSQNNQATNKASPRKKFTTLGDLAANSEDLDTSKMVKKHFKHSGQDQSEETVQRQKNKKMKAIPNNVLLRTGKVVYIVEKKHSRACTGHIRLLQDKNPNQALFAPMDSRLPRILIPMSDCPKDFYERPQDHEKTLFIARIKEWPETSMYAKGEMVRSLGEAGQIEPETEGILMEYDIDFSEFSEDALACLPHNLPWTIPEVELTKRRDLRKDCIFTIDPATARDLDDALSCKSIGNGRYEVGVHIADVSYFVSPDNALDEVAASRATSVYMVQRVIPMLPRLLCEQLCSLNPDEDRLTFSVIWTMDQNGNIEDEWFGRSVIRSCVKLSYDHAQGFIEDPEREWTKDELPPISEGYTIPQIKNIVLQLNKVAQKLRQRRHDSGALRLDQVKLQYTLDKATGMPSGYSVYKQRDSNKLVEEFMLMANMAVARKIYKHFPQLSVLRRHPPPQTRMVDELSSICNQLGIPIDVSSSKAIQESLAALNGESLDQQAKVQILTVLCSKPMQNARYFCTGVIDDEEIYRHYALNVPFYTHFTSPIRRYPDVMVHRLLAASLGYCPGPAHVEGEIQRQCELCNDKKTSAKRVSELSSDMFFAVFVKECGPLEECGMVMAVLDKSFDVLILKLGIVKRVYCEKLPLANHSYRKDKKKPILTLVWKKDDGHPQEVRQEVTIFTRVHCSLFADEQPLKWSAITKHPDDIAA